MARLLFVTGSLRHGGAERHSIALMNRLAERRHECHAVYVKSGADLLERIRLRGSGSVHCLDARRYFDWAALRRFAAHLELRDNVFTLTQSKMDTPGGIYVVSGTASLGRKLGLKLVRDPGHAFSIEGTLDAPRVSAVSAQETAILTQ